MQRRRTVARAHASRSRNRRPMAISATRWMAASLRRDRWRTRNRWRLQPRGGELGVLVVGCAGPLVGAPPLAPAATSPAVRVLPRAATAPVTGRHDACLRFAQPTLEPVWVVDWIRFDEDAP